MREIVISVIAVVLVVCLVLLFSCETIMDTIADKSRDKVEIQVSEYVKEKRELEKELKTLVQTREKTTNGIFRLMLLINNADEVFVEELYPIFLENNIVATLSFDVEYLPSDDSVLTWEMYNSLIEAGWQTSFNYDGALAVEDWYTQYRDAIADSEFQMPTVVVVESESYDKEIENELFELGFTDIIVKRITEYSSPLYQQATVMPYL